MNSDKSRVDRERAFNSQHRMRKRGAARSGVTRPTGEVGKREDGGWKIEDGKEARTGRDRNIELR